MEILVTESVQQPSQSAAPRWQPLSAIDRRVAGVLVEKAKTTPDGYPLSLNAVVTACNQKNNRDPQMELDPDTVQGALDRLRGLGAVGLVQGTGRVDRFRHLLYEWLGVDKVELAVMAELLLRGAQTEGELRGRAARMEPIADLAALRPVLASLKSKGLVLAMTPPGRGYVVAHALYPPDELERVRAQWGKGPGAGIAAGDGRLGESAADSSPAVLAHDQHPRRPLLVADDELASLRDELRQLSETVATLQTELTRCKSEIQDLRDYLKG